MEVKQAMNMFSAILWKKSQVEDQIGAFSLLSFGLLLEKFHNKHSSTSTYV